MSTVLSAGVEDGQTARMQVGGRELFITFSVCMSCMLSPGVEDGQTVRMQVGGRELFITFSVCMSCMLLSPGVEDGQTVRMQVGGRELFITFRVSRSDYFRRDGADIHTDCWVGLTQAVLGGALRVQVSTPMLSLVLDDALFYFDYSCNSLCCLLVHAYTIKYLPMLQNLSIWVIFEEMSIFSNILIYDECVSPSAHPIYIV